MKFKLLIALLFSIKLLSVRSQTRDTVYDGKHYNTLSYYRDYNVSDLTKKSEPGVYYYSLGTTKDEQLDGPIIYFYPTGKIMAKGNFKKGKKLGKWTYYKKYPEQSISVSYSKKSEVKTYYVIDEYDRLEIQDVIKNKKETILLVNGVKTIKKG